MKSELEPMGLSAGKSGSSCTHRELLGSATGFELCSVSLLAREETVARSGNSFRHTSVLCCNGIAQEGLSLAKWGNPYLLGK